MRVNSALSSLSICDRGGKAFEEEALKLGLPYHLASKNYFADCAPETVFVFSFNFDAQMRPRYYHKRHGWELIFEPRGTTIVDLLTLDAAEFERQIRATSGLTDADREHILTVSRHIRSDYISRRPGTEEKLAAIRDMIERIPIGSRLVLLLDDPRIRSADNELAHQEYIAALNRSIASIAAEYPYVGLVDFANAIDDPEQIQVGGNHYDRVVYFTAANMILKALRQLPPRAQAEELLLAV